MARPAKPTVDSMALGLDATRREEMERLRAVVKKALPEAAETVKWNQPVYVFNGRNLICFMIFDDHISFGIFGGSQLRSSRLEGTSKGLKHVKVYKLADIDEKELSRLTKEASTLV
jgi:hypothetical protein